MIEPAPAYDRRNEYENRSKLDAELSQKYDKRSNLVVPFGKTLTFAGSSGNYVAFGYTGGAFQISVDGAAGTSIATTASVTAIENKLVASYGVTVDVNGRASSFKLLSDGTTSDITFKADAFNFFDGVTERALFSAAAGIVTVNGDVAVTGAIVLGGARLKVGLEPLEFSKEDGETMQWAGGVSIGSAPKYTIDVSATAALAAGEQYDVRLTSVTDIGATLRAKIATPGATAGQSETTDSAGGGGDPDRVMHKPTSADAYNAVYNFTISGTVDVTSHPDSENPGTYVHTGLASFSTWFNDGGGWDEGPGIAVDAWEILGYSSGVDETGSHAFEFTYPIDWSAAIGQHGGTEFGVSHESGGSLTDIDEITYTTQSTSGERTATPNGEKVKITAYPRNQE